MGDISASGSGSTGSPRLRLQLFARFELCALPSGERVAISGKRERVLLAFLAARPGGRAPRRKLTTLLWGEGSDESSLDNLRVCVWSLRKALGDVQHQIVASDGEDIVLDLRSVEVDVLEFLRLASAADLEQLDEAAKLYAGEFLEQLDIDSEEFESWRRETATRFQNHALDVLERLMTNLTASGQTGRAIEAGLQILRLEPLHEAAVRRLMLLYAETGRRGAATELYRSLAESLRSELNAQPEPETRALFAEIARGIQKDAVSADPAVAAPAQSRGVSGHVASAETRLVFGPAQEGSRQERRRMLRLWAPLGAVAAVLILAAALVSYSRLQDAPVRTSPNVIAIAVLPFTNMSGDASQDFFSQGMTEDITSALAKIPDLRVVARSSAFQFKGQSQDIRAVGEALGATHLLEGSVRKEGQRLRISAQLIKADDGTHLWADTYDRQVSDVFAIQEEIAEAIAGALRARFGLKPGERLVSNRGIDPDSYQQFLRARPLMRLRVDGVHEAVKILEPVVDRNPDYAPALALLSVSHAYIDSEAALQRLPQAEAEARRAIQSDPNLADAHFALARVLRLQGRLVEADDLFLKALALDPSNADVLDLYMLHLSNVGRLKEALAIGEQLRKLEPYVPAFNADIGQILWLNGQTDAAIQTLTPLNGFGTVRATLAMIYASLGRYDDSVEMLESQASFAAIPQELRVARHQAAAILRTAPKTADAPQSLPRLTFDFSHLDFVYLYVGAPERALETYEDTIKWGQAGGQGGTFAFLWHPSYAPVRKTERFKAFVRDAGMVDYWRAKGWPEFCHPTTGENFACD